MTLTDILIYSLKFMIPAVFSMIFRVVGMGYKSKKRVAVGFSVYFLYLLIVPSLLIYFLGYGEYTHMASLVMIVCSLASVLVISNDTFGKTIFIQMVQINAISVFSTVIGLLRRVIGFSYEVQLLILLIICPLICILALRKWAKPLRFIVDNIHGNILPYLSLSLLIYLIVTILPIYPQQSFNYHPLYITAMMLAVEAVFFLYIYNLYRSLTEIYRLSNLELHKKLLQSEVAAYNDYLQTAKQSRHDQRHHNLLLLEYIKNGEKERAMEYLSQLNEDLNDSALETYCDNSAANSVIRIYNRKAKDKDISFDVQADIPANLPLSETEIATLLSNLLENAYEACDKIKSEKSFISITAGFDEYSLKIELKNSCDSNTAFHSNGMPVSKKQGGGTGTQSIKAVVTRHKGMLKFSQNGEEFITQIILPL